MSLYRQHPEGGARGGTAEVRGKTSAIPPLGLQRPGPPAPKEAHTVRHSEHTDLEGSESPMAVVSQREERGGGMAKVTHSSRDLRVCQVLEMLPAIRARFHSPTLRLHPHLSDQIEL